MTGVSLHWRRSFFCDAGMTPEESLHTAVKDYLNAALGGNAWWSTFPSGGGGRSWQRLLGLKLGVPDILIIDGGRAVWLELKAGKGKVKPHQEACHDALRLARSDVAVVRSLEDVETALTSWGVAIRGRIVHASCG
jgi:hypothetical protein